MPGTRRTSPRYAFKTERELTARESETFGKLAADLKVENPGCGKYMYGELSFDRSLCSFNCVYPSYNGGYDDDYMFLYFRLDRKSGEVKLSHHGDVRLREMELKVSPELERRIIAFLRSITTTRAFSIRKHALAARAAFLEPKKSLKSPSTGGKRKTRRRHR